MGAEMVACTKHPCSWATGRAGPRAAPSVCCGQASSSRRVAKRAHSEGEGTPPKSVRGGARAAQGARREIASGRAANAYLAFKSSRLKVVTCACIRPSFVS
jgi:hypothetical protein